MIGCRPHKGIIYLQIDKYLEMYIFVKKHDSDIVYITKEHNPTLKCTTIVHNWVVMFIITNFMMSQTIKKRIVTNFSIHRTDKCKPAQLCFHEVILIKTPTSAANLNRFFQEFLPYTPLRPKRILPSKKPTV